MDEQMQPNQQEKPKSSLWAAMSRQWDEAQKPATARDGTTPTPALTPQRLDQEAADVTSGRTPIPDLSPSNPDMLESAVPAPGGGALARLARGVKAAADAGTAGEGVAGKVTQYINKAGERVTDYGQRLKQPLKTVGEGIKIRD